MTDEDDHDYRATMWCIYCGFTDSRMLEPSWGYGEDTDDDICLCDFTRRDGPYYDLWPLKPLFGNSRITSSPAHLQVPGASRLPATPLTRTVYPVLKVHPIWLQMELMRLFPETVDFRAGDAGLSERENQGKTGSDNIYYPWTRPRDDIRNVRKWDGTSPPSAFGAIGGSVPFRAGRNSLLLSPSTDEDGPWSPGLPSFSSSCRPLMPTSSTPDSPMSTGQTNATCLTPQFMLTSEEVPVADNKGGYRFVNESFPPLGGAKKAEGGPEPLELSSTFSSDSDGGLVVKATPHWSRRCPPKPPRFATKKKLRHCRSST